MKLASLTACLFCFAADLSAQTEVFFSDRAVQKAHAATLDLRFAEARAMLGTTRTSEATYVASLNDVLELLLTEDPSLYQVYEQSFENRLFKNPKSPDEKFLLAEMNLQWAFVYLKFGHELDAASHFREAYKIAMDCRRKFPQYLPIRKTTGMLEVMVGAVPEKYNWVMDLFGIHGSIDNGLKDLSMIGSSSHELAGEARLLKAMISGYVLQQAAMSAAELHRHLEVDSSSSLALGAASLYIKSAQSEKAIPLLQPLRQLTPLVNYFLGEVLLQRGDYGDAIKSYKNFIDTYKGSNNLKDAWFKTGICHLLRRQSAQADSAFAVARETGDDIVEADRSAARTLSTEPPSNLALVKVRYATDGGYYEQARLLLDQVAQHELVRKKDNVEYFYRRARLEHGTQHHEASKIFYQQVIDMAGSEPWYFAPNACLQMGYLLLEQGDQGRAKEFFKKALSYKNHEYKNSIDSKAKTALNRMKK